MGCRKRSRSRLRMPRARPLAGRRRRSRQHSCGFRKVIMPLFLLVGRSLEMCIRVDMDRDADN